MGYLFLVVCIIIVVAMVVRDKRKKAASQSSDSVSSGNTSSRQVTFNFENIEPIFFWTIVPLIFGVVFYTCVYSPVQSCTNRLDTASNKATAEMQHRDRQSRLMYLDYQRRAWPNRHAHSATTHRRASHPDDAFQNLTFDPDSDYE